MKGTIKKIKSKIDWIMIIFGSYMVAYGIFDFECLGRPWIQIGPRLSPIDGIRAYGYYYESFTKINIATGIILIVWGILIYKEKRRDLK